MPLDPHASLPLDLENGVVTMTHGGGGRAMGQLIENLFLPAFDNAMLQRQDDQAQFSVPAGRLAMSTDAHVISPLFFPGGDIGCLSVYGTINDVAMAGARPLYLAASFILEEGLPLADLKNIVDSMGQAARQAGVPIVTGDTKVVERGKADGVFITTTGVGLVPSRVDIAAEKAQAGDKILLSGSIGDHGIAVLSQREGLVFDAPILSDTAPLHQLVAQMVMAVPDIHCLRDPTRGGLAAALNELAQASGVGMMIDEATLPISPVVAGACELLGLDPLNIANEGKLVAICPPERAEILLKAIQSHPLGEQAAIIGEVIEDRHHFVQMKTAMGGVRVVDWLAGEPLPRIC